MEKTLFIVISAFALLFAACAPVTEVADEVDEADPMVADAGVETCENLRGEYVARNVGFTSVADPDIAETFEDADYRINFGEGTFTSTYMSLETGPIERSGAFGFNDDVVTFGDDATEPLFPGAVGGAQNYRCELTDDGFTLVSDASVGYDFGEGVEEATFEGEFEEF